MAIAQIIDQPPEAVDRVYAQSLFELAEAKGGRPLLEDLADEMDQLEDIRARDAQMMEFWRSRVVPAKVKIQVLGAACEGRLNPLLRDTMQLLARKERLDRVWRIFAAFKEMLDAKFGKVEVDVYTRFPMSADEVEALRVRLKSFMQREPVMHAYIDEAMIGGIKLQVGDKLMDASIAASLRRMREKLLENGSSAIRSRADRMIEGD